MYCVLCVWILSYKWPLFSPLIFLGLFEIPCQERPCPSNFTCIPQDCKQSPISIWALRSCIRPQLRVHIPIHPYSQEPESLHLLHLHWGLSGNTLRWGSLFKNLFDKYVSRINMYQILGTLKEEGRNVCSYSPCILATVQTSLQNKDSECKMGAIVVCNSGSYHAMCMALVLSTATWSEKWAPFSTQYLLMF